VGCCANDDDNDEMRVILVIVLYHLKIKKDVLDINFPIRVCVLTQTFSWNITILCQLFLNFKSFCHKDFSYCKLHFFSFLLMKEDSIKPIQLPMSSRYFQLKYSEVLMSFSVHDLFILCIYSMNYV
jgi:hypothetical protein